MDIKVKQIERLVTLNLCPPGLFLFNGALCFRTEYRDHNGAEAYVVQSGEYFWGGTNRAEDRGELLVNPITLP